MLIPCHETYTRMVGAHAGLWPELVNDGSDIELAVKLNSDLAKAILKGAIVTLMVAVIQVSGQLVRIVGLRIEDDNADPAFLHQPQESSVDQQFFVELLSRNGSRITFFDELVRPIMSGRVFWAEMDSASAIAALTRTGPHYQGDSKTVLEEAMVCALRNCAKWHRNEGPLDALAWAVLPLRFERLEPLNVSSPEAGDFSMDNLDEGGGLEKSVYLLLEANFPGAVYLNPQFDHGSERREFADLLVVTDTDLLIIQSKVMAILERNPLQKTERRVANVFSHFRKGISQLKGSVRTLRQRKMVFTKQGVPIKTEPDKEKAIHGIVLLSTTNLCLPWPEMGAELVSASRKSGAKFHVLDLIEFQQHVAFGKSLGRLFAYLNKRFEVVSSGNANVKTYFLNEENQGVSSSPIEDEAVGYLFLFAVNGNAEIDGGSILTVFQKPLKADGFTGRFEYFQDIGLIDGKPVFAVAIGIQWNQELKKYPSYDWWSAFAEKVRPDLETNPNLTVSSLSKAVTLGKIRASQTLVLVTEFVDGKAVGFLDPDETAEK